MSNDEAERTEESALRATLVSAEGISLSSRRGRSGLGRGGPFFLWLACSAAIRCPSPRPSPRSILTGRGSRICRLSCGHLSTCNRLSSLFRHRSFVIWALRTASTTRWTLMPVMHRKSIGQSRRKQGEQGVPAVSKACRGSPGSPGPVSSGEVLPKGTTTGVPSAAATCIGPLSLVSRTRQHLSRVISSRKEVFPARLSVSAPGVWRPISSHNLTSLTPPNNNQAQPGMRFETSRTTSANFSSGQRFAGPYSAPGFRPKRRGGLPCECSDAWARSDDRNKSSAG